MGAPALTRYVSVQQVATSLGCTDQHVYNLIREGALADTINIGTDQRPAYRVPETSLKAFIAARTVTQAA